jgi:hypothetical protein
MQFQFFFSHFLFTFFHLLSYYVGMHRSGTSVLGGLINKMGLKTGGPLIAPAEDNEKGFFERIDVVYAKRTYIIYLGC